MQDVVPITSYDTAGSFLLLGCNNGSIYYIGEHWACFIHEVTETSPSVFWLHVFLSSDMQKFPLRMKDNDLLVTELYHDPSNDAITALSVYLTPKTSQYMASLGFFEMPWDEGMLRNASMLTCAWGQTMFLSVVLVHSDLLLNPFNETVISTDAYGPYWNGCRVPLI